MTMHVEMCTKHKYTRSDSRSLLHVQDNATYIQAYVICDNLL